MIANDTLNKVNILINNFARSRLSKLIDSWLLFRPTFMMFIFFNKDTLNEFAIFITFLLIIFFCFRQFIMRMKTKKVLWVTLITRKSSYEYFFFFLLLVTCQHNINLKSIFIFNYSWTMSLDASKYVVDYIIDFNWI